MRNGIVPREHIWTTNEKELRAVRVNDACAELGPQHVVEQIQAFTARTLGTTADRRRVREEGKRVIKQVYQGVARPQRGLVRGGHRSSILEDLRLWLWDIRSRVKQPIPRAAHRRHLFDARLRQVLL